MDYRQAIRKVLSELKPQQDIRLKVYDLDFCWEFVYLSETKHAKELMKWNRSSECKDRHELMLEMQKINPKFEFSDDKWLYSVEIFRRKM
jgi:hypothetical protein